MPAKTFTADVALQIEQSKTFTGIAAIAEKKSKTFTADAFLRYSFARLVQEDLVKVTELFEATLVTGETFYFTAHNENILWGSPSKLYKALPISRTSVGSKLNLQPDRVTLNLTGITSDLADAVENNQLDYLQLSIKKVIWNEEYGEGMEFVTFAGIANAAYNRNTLTLSCSSILYSLAVPFPPVSYHVPCNWSLFSTPCGLVQSSYKISSSATSDSANAFSVVDSSFFLPVSPADAKKFHQGELKVTSGDNNGSRRSILSAVDGLFVLAVPLPFNMSAGDTFDYYPGCDKTPGTCNSRFSNLANFMGFVYLPPAEEALF